MKRIALIVLALILGIGGVVSLVGYVQSSDERARAGQELTAVYVVTSRVPAGSPVAAVVAATELTDVPLNVRAPTAVTDPALLDGLVTLVDLVPGEQLLTDRFGEAAERTVAGGQVALPEGMLEASISLSPDRAVGGQIQPGDQVAVVASFTPDSRPPFSHVLFHKVLVINVQTADATADPDPDGAEDPTRTGAPARPRQTPASSLLLTLAVTPPQAERLVYSNEFGTIWLTRESPLTPEDGTDIVTIDNLFEGPDAPVTLSPLPESTPDVAGDVSVDDENENADRLASTVDPAFDAGTGTDEASTP